MKQFEVWLIDLEPASGSEIKKTRPCVIISPDEMDGLKTRIVAPLTSTPRDWHFRIDCFFQKTRGQVALDQMRCIDLRARKSRKVGKIDAVTAQSIKTALQEMFT